MPSKKQKQEEETSCKVEVQNEQTKDEKEVQETQESNDVTLKDEYLNLARVIQADFDNYRKRSILQIEKAKIDGIASTVEVLLPSLDAFKNVKEKVKDAVVLEGIDMLERQIQASLQKLGVQKIESLGLELDPNVHNVLAVAKDETKPDGIILQEFQAGYKMGDKIIRCSQVLVNKL